MALNKSFYLLTYCVRVYFVCCVFLKTAVHMCYIIVTGGVDLMGLKQA